MSEHPELREALAAELARLIGRTSLQTWADIADALLAGPVGKLQAELAEAQRKDDPTCWPECGECHTAYVHRYALHFTRGRVWVWQQDCKHGRKGTPQPAPRIVYADAAAGEPAVTGTVDDEMRAHGFVPHEDLDTYIGDCPVCGDELPCPHVTVIEAAGESAVTGEAT